MSEREDGGRRFESEIEDMARQARAAALASSVPIIRIAAHTRQEVALTVDELTKHRLDEQDKRADKLEAKLDAIGSILAEMRTDLKVGLASKPGRGDIWGAAVTVIVFTVGTIVAVGGLLLASSANQLSAFQAGLSSVQTAVATKAPEPSPAVKP